MDDWFHEVLFAIKWDFEFESFQWGQPMIWRAQPLNSFEQTRTSSWFLDVRGAGIRNCAMAGGSWFSPVEFLVNFFLIMPFSSLLSPACIDHLLCNRITKSMGLVLNVALRAHFPSNNICINHSPIIPQTLS